MLLFYSIHFYTRVPDAERAAEPSRVLYPFSSYHPSTRALDTKPSQSPSGVAVPSRVARPMVDWSDERRLVIRHAFILFSCLLLTRGSRTPNRARHQTECRAVTRALPSFLLLPFDPGPRHQTEPVTKRSCRAVMSGLGLRLISLPIYSSFSSSFPNSPLTLHPLTNHHRGSLANTNRYSHRI